MKNKLIWIILFILLVSCNSMDEQSRKEALVSTIVAQVNEELAHENTLTPQTSSPAIPTSTSSQSIPTKTFLPPKQSTISPSEVSAVPDVKFGPSNFPSNINPLTGLSVKDTRTLNRRPISIKVSNYPRSIRPQWGLSQADQIFEYYHEAGLTRFNAIFYSNDVDRIGPIRSGRFSDVDIVTSSSIAKLLKLRKTLVDCDKRLVFCSVNTKTKKIFTLTGLNNVFEFVDDQFVALAGLQLT